MCIQLLSDSSTATEPRLHKSKNFSRTSSNVISSFDSLQDDETYGMITKYLLV